MSDLQGNIVKSHGRDHSVLLFVRWRNDCLSEVRRWIAGFAEGWITSAAMQFEEARRFRESGAPGQVFGSLYLSRLGYEALGFSGAQLPADRPFRMGMQHDELAASLGDPPPGDWEPGYRQPCHALILLADDDLILLLQTVNRLTQDLRGCAEILQREDGFVMRNEQGQAIEHFGYVDGVSQPLFMLQDIQRERQLAGSPDRWDSRAPLGLVLVKDPNGKLLDSCGSYLVVRKLEQNVRQFNQAIRHLAQELDVDVDRAGALTIGRFQNGTPISESDQPSGEPGNNFNFAADPEGRRCPFHAHVRKTNPRGDTVREFNMSDGEERSHRIVRRAMSYGSHRRQEEPETDSGLLFLCFQANIENQFNFIQARWANAANFLRVGVGADPLIGQPAGKQHWPTHWGEGETREFSFPLPVSMKGGEYFFAPSISFLRSLAP
ncbi:MAG: Dyp-type peroxidase [Cyanobacteriota bacterium]|nr:Dyp-type peroxidase [Cyanobacteriota bacterium]